MIRFFLKLWPAFLPILIYFFWVFVIEKFVLQKILKKKTDIEGEKIVGEGSTQKKKAEKFSLQNRNFVATLYISLVVAILMLIKLGINK